MDTNIVSELTPDKIEELTALLHKATPDMAARLLRLFERAKVQGTQAIPAQDLLGVIRQTATGRIGPVDRLPGLDRLFFEPFEGLFESASEERLAPGGISREGLAQTWSILSEQVIRDACADRLVAGRQAVLRGDLAVARRMAAELRDGASAVFAAKPGLASDLAAQDASAAAVLRRMPDLLAAEQAARPALAGAQNSHGDLSDAVLPQLIASAARLERLSAGAAAELALLVMASLPKPWQALRVPLGMSRGADDRRLAMTEFNIVGQRLIALMEREAAPFAAAANGRDSFDPETLAHCVDRFGQFAQGFEREMRFAPDGPWRKAMSKVMREAAGALETVCQRAATLAESSLPSDRTRVKGAGLMEVPRLSVLPNAERVQRTVEHLAFLRAVRLYAAAAGFGAARETAARRAAQHLAMLSEHLLNHRGSSLPEEHLAAWTEAARACILALEGEEPAKLFARRMAA